MKKTILLFTFLLSSIFHLRGDDIAKLALDEMLDGKTLTYKVEDAAYRGPTDFSIEYPKSWVSKDFNRPGVLSRISADNGNGMDSLVIVVNRGRSGAENLKPKEVFNEEFMKRFNLPGAFDIKSEYLETDYFEGIKFEYFFTQSKAPLVIKTYVSNYIFTQRGALVQLQFYTLLTGTDDGAEKKRIEAFKPLWHEIVKTVNIPK